jgi:hypothetical protein
MIQGSDDVLFGYVVLFRYVSHYNLKSNEDLKRFLRLYPMYREEIIDFTATWRALSILDKFLPAPVVDRQPPKQAEAQPRRASRRRAS